MLKGKKLSNIKWKTDFLKTGLPLEYVTANALSKMGHTIFGEYPYNRPNENEDLFGLINVLILINAFLF